MKTIKFLTLLLLFCSFDLYSKTTTDTIFINTSKEFINPNKPIYFFTPNYLDIKEAVSLPFKSKDSIDHFYVNGWVWVKFTIKNNTQKKHFVLYTEGSHLEGFFLYKPTKTGYVPTEAAKYHPEDGREVFSKIPSFFIDVEPDEIKTYYLRVSAMNESVDFDYIVSDLSEYSKYSQTESFIMGLYYGILLVIFLINIFYYFSLKDKLFGLYAFYVICNIVIIFAFEGLWYLIIPDGGIALQINFFGIRFWLDSLLFFLIHLVNLKKSNPLLVKSIYAFLIYHVCILGVLQLFNVFDIMIYFMGELEQVNILAGLILILITLIKSYKLNRYLLKYYIIIFGFMFASFVVTIAYNFYSPNGNFLLFKHTLKFVSLVEIIALSFAVARRFKLTANELKIKKNEEQILNNKVEELEMDLRKAQMNPHFMFNALSSIQSFILEKNTQDATSYLSKFAKLMRLTLDHSRSRFVPLKDEITSVKIYIELEFLRLKHVNSFEININDDLNTDHILIPPMLIQPFLENAIWHGLQNKDSAGKIIINITLENKELLCVIEDDGYGIELMKEKISKTHIAKHKSSGILITQERLTLIHKLLGTNYELKIEDRKNEGISGTRVKFKIPYKHASLEQS